MARRRKATRRRRSRTFRVLNAVEAYLYANVLSMGLFNTSPLGFLTGPGDITNKSDFSYDAVVTQFGNSITSPGYASVGADQISLQDIISNPGYALATAQGRGGANLIGMAMQAATIGVGMRITKALLRRPLASVNRNIMKPLFGKAVAL